MGTPKFYLTALVECGTEPQTASAPCIETSNGKKTIKLKSLCYRWSWYSAARHPTTGLDLNKNAAELRACGAIRQKSDNYLRATGA
jgi:hypothetical protein